MKKSVFVVLLVILFALKNNVIASAAQPEQQIQIYDQTTTITTDKTAEETFPKYYLDPKTWREFEKGATNVWRRNMANDTYSGSVSTKYSHDGVQAYRFELRKDDQVVCDGKRSEIETKAEPAADERTYQFSSLLPKGGDEDFVLDPQSTEIIAQWHNTPDPGEEWTNPPLSLHVSGDGHYYLWRFWDDAPITTDDKMISEGKKAIYDLGSYLDDKGEWVDWRFHVKWGWLPSQHPIIQVYKNGKKIFELKDQPNTTNDQKGVYMQFGIYKWEWGHPEVDESIVTKRIVYFDNVSML